MKKLGNATAMVTAAVLMGALLLAQRDYQRSFGGNVGGQVSATDDSGSVAAYGVDREIVVMK
jgi:hypothetical protein